MTGIAWVSLSTIVLTALFVCGMFAFHARRSVPARPQRQAVVMAFAATVLGWLLLAAFWRVSSCFRPALRDPLWRLRSGSDSPLWRGSCP